MDHIGVARTPRGPQSWIHIIPTSKAVKGRFGANLGRSSNVWSWPVTAPREGRASDNPRLLKEAGSSQTAARLHAPCYRCSYLASFSSRRDRRGAMTVPCDCGNHRPKIMETVAFISTENGDDLIVSFAVIDPADPTDRKPLPSAHAEIRTPAGRLGARSERFV